MKNKESFDLILENKMLSKDDLDLVKESLINFCKAITESWNDYKTFLEQKYDFTMSKELESQRLSNLYFFSESDSSMADEIITFLITGSYFDFFFPGKKYLDEFYPPFEYEDIYNEYLSK